MDKQINEFPPLTELTEDTIFHVKDGLIDKYVTKDVVAEGLAEEILVDASTTQKGVVQLNNTTSSTSITEAATANAVKIVADGLAGKLSAATEVIAGDGLTGGGALTADVTVTLGTPSTLSTSTTNVSSSTTHTHEVTFPITTVAGRTGDINLVSTDIEDSTTVGRGFLTSTSPSAITFPRVNADNTVTHLSASDFRNAIGAGSAVGGSVTSVGVDVPTGFTVTGSPVTESGIIEIDFDTGYSLPLESSQTNWDTAYTQTLQWNGGATGLNAATGRTSLGATTVGSNFFTTANPSAITFPRVNANNTVSFLNASDFRDAIGAGSGGGSGTVTSVGMVLPTGLTVTGSPVTSSGTFTIDYDIGYSIPTTDRQDNWDTAYADRLKWSGTSTGLNAATGRTSLGATTVGSNFFTTANPSAITFPRVNADNTVSYLSASSSRTALGLGTAATLNADVNNTTNTVVKRGSDGYVEVGGIGCNGEVVIYSTSAANSVLQLYSDNGGSGTAYIRTQGATPYNIVIAPANNIAATFDSSQNTTLSGDLEVAGDVTISGTGRKIMADMSSGGANLLTFQSSTVNGNTIFNIAPNGTGNIGGINLFNATDVTNSSYLGVSARADSTQITSGKTGSGVIIPLYVNATVGVGIVPANIDSSCKLQVGDGVKLGNTANTNTNVLDWYEEGTFTPVATGTTIAGTGTYTGQSGRYTRVGNKVLFTIDIRWSAHSGTGSLIISGLPFVAGASPVCAFSFFYNGLVAGAGREVTATLPSGTSSFTVRYSDPTGTAGQVPLPAVLTSLTITGHYFV